MPFIKEFEWESVKLYINRVFCNVCKGCLVVTGATHRGLKIAAFLAKLAGFYASLNTDSNGLMLKFDMHTQN